MNSPLLRARYASVLPVLVFAGHILQWRKASVGSRATRGGIHAYRYHRRWVGRRDTGAKLGAAPSLLAPVPPKPKYWSRAYYARLVGELIAVEDVIAGMLGATVKALERRKGRLHGPR